MSKGKKTSSRNRPQCRGVKPNGAKCSLTASPGSRFCFWHDQKRQAERRVAQATGGRRGSAIILPADSPDIEISSARDVVGLLSQTVNQVRRGQLDVRVANSVAYICGYILKAREQGEIDDRLAKVEAALKSGGIR